MTKHKGIALLLIGAMVAMIALAACDSEAGSPAGQGTTGFLPAGLLGSQNVDSLAKALEVGGVASVLGQTLSGQQTGIWVTGRGEVTADPDLALLNLGVEATADTVAEARGEAADALTAMVQVLKDAGLEDADIQTRYFNIQPQYTSREVTRCVDEEPSAPAPMPPVRVPESDVERTFKDECYTTWESVIVGYRVNNQITAKIRDLEASGDIIDAVAEAGGDLVRINGISFTVEDSTALETQAREAAVLAMVAKAQQMAQVAGAELGRLVFISETGGASPRIATDFAMAMPAPAFAEGATTPISVGELEVSVTVQGVFAIAE